MISLRDSPYLGISLGCWLAGALVPSLPARAADVSVKLDAGSGFSVQNSTATIERLRVDEATGNISRNGALFVHTTGVSNTFVGAGAGNTSTTGSGYNSAFGIDALHDNTTGYGNSAFGRLTLASNTVGNLNTGFGLQALYTNTTGNLNSAFGSGALVSNSTGSSNAAFGNRALFANSTGYANSAVGATALRANTTGYDNTAIGAGALYSNGAGNKNAAVGRDSLRSNTAGVQMATLGAASLRANTTGGGNSAVGFAALYTNTTGGQHSAVGQNALRSNTTGIQNSVIGAGALYNNTTGSRNAALGKDAGINQTTGSDNIYLVNAGVAGESGRIKIGTVGTHTQATIAGIHGSTSSGGIAVLVNASGTLGTTTSSARFKQNVHDMADASELVMKLRPVVFHYREDAVGAEEAKETQYGLIAEEVAQVAPELVAPDLEGKPYSVKYHVLPALLLNEVQKQERRIATLASRLAAIEEESGTVCVEGGR